MNRDEIVNQLKKIKNDYPNAKNVVIIQGFRMQIEEWRDMVSGLRSDSNAIKNDNKRKIIKQRYAAIDKYISNLYVNDPNSSFSACIVSCKGLHVLPLSRSIVSDLKKFGINQSQSWDTFHDTIDYLIELYDDYVLHNIVEFSDYNYVYKQLNRTKLCVISNDKWIDSSDRDKYLKSIYDENLINIMINKKGNNVIKVNKKDKITIFTDKIRDVYNYNDWYFIKRNLTKDEIIELVDKKTEMNNWETFDLIIRSISDPEKQKLLLFGKEDIMFALKNCQIKRFICEESMLDIFKQSLDLECFHNGMEIISLTKPQNKENNALYNIFLNDYGGIIGETFYELTYLPSLNK